MTDLNLILAVLTLTILAIEMSWPSAPCRPGDEEYVLAPLLSARRR